MTETITENKKTDPNTLWFYAGLALLFSGMWICFGIGMALIVLGAILSAVSFVNSYAVIWLSRT
jgi:hypothetical protein